MDRAEEKMEKLTAALRDMGKVAVAYSGGADSTFLLKVARDTLGDGAVAIFNASDLLSSEETESAVAGARELGVEVVVIRVSGLDDPEFRENRPDRCYVCKKGIFRAIIAAAGERGIENVVDGGHVDDRREDRPGMRALEELGVRSPLAEAGLTKEEIRALSKRIGLRTADKPASPCLATRIPFYQPITREKLRQVDRAERYLHRLGFEVVRVRHHGTVARIEVPPGDFPKVIENREAIASELRSIGFTYVDLDLLGFRSGSMSEALRDPAAGRG